MSEITADAVIVEPAPRKGRALKVIVTIVVVLAALVAGFIALDAFARQQIANYVEEKVREVLSLGTDQPVAVDIAGTSVIAQVVTGSLEQIEVGVDDVTIGDLSGGVSLRANGVPVDASRPVDRVQIEFTVDEEGIQSIANTLSATAIDSVQLVDGEIRFGTEFAVFGIPFAVGVGVEPFASGGEIGFTPTSVEIAGTRSSAESLISTFGRPAEELLQTRTFCVAQFLPEALGVDDVEVLDDSIVVTIGASKALFDESSLSTLGSCG